MSARGAAALRRLAGVLPPPLRRAASGLMVDVQSLPARLSDPERRRDPWAVLHNVGGGDYRAVGRALLAELIEHGGLRPGDRVLDIGCGAGRVALPLAAYLDSRGADEPAYVGFDVSHSAIRHCARTIGAGRRDFRFVHADIANHDYNAAGAIAEADYRFPVETGWADVVFATSVFSHLRIESIAHYVAEAARVLAPGGRFVFTAYALTPERREAIAAGRAALPFQAWRDGAVGTQAAMVMDPRSPERAIAHDEAALVQATHRAGLILAKPWRRGGWAPGATYGGFQDLFVAIAARSAEGARLDSGPAAP